MWNKQVHLLTFCGIGSKSSLLQESIKLLCLESSNSLSNKEGIFTLINKQNLKKIVVKHLTKNK